jgi:hypothetical protein
MSFKVAGYDVGNTFRWERGRSGQLALACYEVSTTSRWPDDEVSTVTPVMESVP